MKCFFVFLAFLGLAAAVVQRPPAYRHLRARDVQDSLALPPLAGPLHASGPLNEVVQDPLGLADDEDDDGDSDDGDDADDGAADSLVAVGDLQDDDCDDGAAGCDVGDDDDDDDGDGSGESPEERLERLRAEAQAAGVGGFASTGSMHRCQYNGLARVASGGVAGLYELRFTDADCQGGLPSGRCFSGLRRATQCGRPEAWSVLPADSDGGAGVLWRNDEPCLPVDGAAQLAVDFFCPAQHEGVHLHRCTLSGELSDEDVVVGDDDSGRGARLLKWKPSMCENGLPPAPSKERPQQRCLTALRWMEHCGGDHDWAAVAPDEGAAGLSWFASHPCKEARLAVDYYCPLGPTGVEFQQRLHRCTFDGAAVNDPDFRSCFHKQYGHSKLALRNPRGQCRLHEWQDAQCTNGLPQGSCVTVLHRGAECGSEGDWQLTAPTEGAPAVRWYNARSGGACGDAHLTVDYYCYNACVRRCAHGGKLREQDCTCDCGEDSPWTGSECRQCSDEARCGDAKLAAVHEALQVE